MVTVQMSYENLGNFPRFEITLLQLNLTAFPTIKKPKPQNPIEDICNLSLF